MATLGEGSSPRKWNRLVKANHKSYLVLRETEEGRSAIEALMSHDSPTVRSWAAAHALLWNETARPVLEALASEGGLVSVNANYTLIEYDRGRLSHDWLRVAAVRTPNHFADTPLVPCQQRSPEVSSAAGAAATPATCDHI